MVLYQLDRLRRCGVLINWCRYIGRRFDDGLADVVRSAGRRWRFT